MPIVPTQRQNSLEGVWKIVIKKSKDTGKQVSFQSARTLVSSVL